MINMIGVVTFISDFKILHIKRTVTSATLHLLCHPFFPSFLLFPPLLIPTPPPPHLSFYFPESNLILLGGMHSGFSCSGGWSSLFGGNFLLLLVFEIYCVEPTLLLIHLCSGLWFCDFCYFCYYCYRYSDFLIIFLPFDSCVLFICVISNLAQPSVHVSPCGTHFVAPGRVKII
jgi:hypothetical protein